MILREKLLALEAEKRKPNVRVRRMLERCSDSSKNVIHSIAHCVDAKKTRVRELWDFHKGK